MFLRKTGLCLAMVLWCVMAARVLGGSLEKPKDVVEAFCSANLNDMSAYVTAYGYYGNTDLTTINKENLLINMASCLGMSGPYSFCSDQEDGRETVKVEHQTEEAGLVIQVISLYEDSSQSTAKQYIHMELTLKNDFSSLLNYQELMETILDESCIDGTVNVYLEGVAEGALNYKERGEIADGMLSLLGAEIVAENRDEEIYTIYAYSDAIEDAISVAGYQVNINISASYDEINDQTRFYLASPMNNLDY